MEREGASRQSTTKENQTGTAFPITVLNGEQILPPSLKGTRLSPAEFATRFPVRHQALLLASSQQPEGTTDSLTLQNRLRALNNLDRYSASHRSSNGRRTLREKQFNVFTDIHTFLEEGNTEGYVEAPTGFGKTVLFAEVVKATGVRTLIVVPTKILVEQTYDRIKELNPDLEVGRMYSDKKEPGKQVTITTYQSLALTHGGQNPDEFDLLILDEAHQTLTERRVEAVQQFKNAIKLGFTATPEYTRDKRVENLLNNEIHVITIKDAVESGLLSSFSVYLAETSIDLTNVKVTQSGEYDEQELEEAIDIESRNRSALELYQRLVDQNPDLAKAIIYCVSVKHAINVAKVFQDSGVKTAAVWGDMPKEEQDQIIQDYRDGVIDVISNVLLLTEGFDEPKAALCLNLRPTLSRVVAKQRGGRVLRLDPENPYKHAIIVDYMDKSEDRRNLQVTFAQVAEGAQIINPASLPPTSPRTPGPPGRPGPGPIPPIDIDPRKLVIDGLNVVTDTEEVLRIIREIEGRLYESAPVGWETLLNASRITGRSWDWINRNSKILAEEHPDWVKPYLEQHNRLYLHLSPEAIEYLKESAHEYQPAPEGWTTTKALARLLKRTTTWIDPQVEEIRVEHPEWFKLYMDSSNRIFEYISPEVGETIRARSTEVPKSPEGWETLSAISKRIGKTKLWISSRISDLRERQPEYFQTYLNEGNRATEHFHPNVVTFIESEKNGLQTSAPDGWYAASNIGRQLNKSTKWALARFAKLRKEHPEWFRTYITPGSGKQSEHISPEGLELLKGESATIIKAPDGWLSSNETAESLGHSLSWIKPRMKKLRKTHPDWFREYLDGKSSVVEHLSPEAIEWFSQNP